MKTRHFNQDPINQLGFPKISLLVIPAFWGHTCWRGEWFLPFFSIKSREGFNSPSRSTDTQVPGSAIPNLAPQNPQGLALNLSQQMSQVTET